MNDALFSSKNMCWCTPEDFFNKLDEEFGFVLDPAATDKTAKCSLYYPARTDTSYFHDYIYGKAEIRFIRGRLRFTDEDGNSTNSAPFPSMIVIYNGK